MASTTSSDVGSYNTFPDIEMEDVNIVVAKLSNHANILKEEDSGATNNNKDINKANNNKDINKVNKSTHPPGETTWLLKKKMKK